ncbi:MAG: DUF4139 domain-containing protein [Polyangiaceae bacterium]
MIRALLLLGLTSTVIACSSGPRAADPKAGATGPANRERVGLTIYNGNFGLVREIRTVDLPGSENGGKVTLDFGDVSAHLQPSSVVIRSLDDAASLDVLEQNYRYDLLTPYAMMEKYVGKDIKVIRWNEKLGHDEEHDAKLLSIQGGTVVDIGGEITPNYAGRMAFPGVPENLIAKPTLTWLVTSKAPKQKVEVTYLSDALNWKADYVLQVDKDDQLADLHGWVTLTNETGTSFPNADLQLVAGDVQRVRQELYRMKREVDYEAEEEQKAQDDFREEGLFEYHLYTLNRTTDVLDKESKQVTLLDASGVKVKKKLILNGAAQYYRGAYYEPVERNAKVGVFLDIENAEGNQLGVPLPMGSVRVYKQDKSGSLQFIGEDAIEHTPKDEKIRVKMGDAFDVVADRKQTYWDSLGECGSESEFEIELRNHKDVAEDVELVEPASGEWEIVKSSHPAKKKDSKTFTFDVNVPARGKTVVTYRVRVEWC